MDIQINGDFNHVKRSRRGKGLKFKSGEEIIYQSTRFRHLPKEFRKEMIDKGVLVKGSTLLNYSGTQSFRNSQDSFHKWTFQSDHGEFLQYYILFESQSEYGDIHYFVREVTITGRDKQLANNDIYEIGRSYTSEGYDDKKEKVKTRFLRTIYGDERLELSDTETRRKWDYFHRPIVDFLFKEYEEYEKHYRKAWRSNLTGLIILVFASLVVLWLVSSFLGESDAPAEFILGTVILLLAVFGFLIYQRYKRMRMNKKYLRTLAREQKEYKDQVPTDLPADKEMEDKLKAELKDKLLNDIKPKYHFHSPIIFPERNLGSEWATSNGCIDLIELGVYQTNILNRSKRIDINKLNTLRLTGDGRIIGRIYELIFIFATAEKIIIHNSVFDFVRGKLYNEKNIDFYYRDIVQIKDEVIDAENKNFASEKEAQEILSLSMSFTSGENITISHPLRESIEYLQREFAKQKNEILDLQKKGIDAQKRTKIEININEAIKNSKRAIEFANFLRGLWNEHIQGTLTSNPGNISRPAGGASDLSVKLMDALENPC